MAYDYELLGWMDADGERHLFDEGDMPESMDTVAGALVHAADDEGWEHIFWVYAPPGVEAFSWDDWEAIAELEIEDQEVGYGIEQ